MSIEYLTMYNSDGEISRVISCPADHVIKQRTRSGEFMIEGKADGDTQKIVDGKIVNKTIAEITALKTTKKGSRLRFESASRKTEVTELEET